MRAIDYWTIGLQILIPIVLITFLVKGRARFTAIGGLIGYAFWLVDYDFTINPAGPSPRLSPAIAEAIAPSLSYRYDMLIGLLVLTLIGVAIGFGVEQLLKSLRRSD